MFVICHHDERIIARNKQQVGILTNIIAVQLQMERLLWHLRFVEIEIFCGHKKTLQYTNYGDYD